MEVTKGENIKIVLVNDEAIEGTIKDVGTRGITIKKIVESRKDIINEKGKYVKTKLLQREYEIFIPWTSVLYIEKFIEEKEVGEVIED